MFKWITNAYQRMNEQETLPERKVRMIPGAVFGIIGVSAYTLTLSLINVLTFPGLHIALDWVNLFSYWIGFSLALGLAGLLVGWFTEDYMGIIVGGLIMTGLLLLFQLLASLVSHGTSSMVATSVVTVLPLVGACVLLAGGIRWAIIRYLHIQHDEPVERRKRLVAGLVGLIFVIGFIPGALGRYDNGTADVLRSINQSLAAAPTDPALAQARFPVQQYPNLQKHFGMAYGLYPRGSAASAGSIDVTIRFSDGYALTCVVPSTSAGQVYLRDCSEGNEYIPH